MAMELRLLLGVAFFCFLHSHLVLAFEKEDDSLNVSSVNWATSMDADHLQSHPEFSMEDDVVDDGDADGGFSSLDSMLQWAIGRSDPTTMKGVAQAMQNLTSTELEARQLAIKELVESLRMPSEADLMKTAISDLRNFTLSVEDRQRALQELLELVEPIDNANDLHKLGGLVVVVEELNRTEESLRILAAWILGKASQNNRVVQDQLLELGVLPRLMQMARSRSAEEAVKALYALSAIIRNQPLGQEHFYLLGGALLLEDLMKDASSDIRLRRKSLYLVADLAEQQKEFGGVLMKYEPSKSYLMSIVNLVVVAEDLDTQEKALLAIRSLSDLSRTAHSMLRHECDIESTLDKLQVQLDVLMQSDDNVDFAKDLQMLCQNVRSMFSDQTNVRTSSH
eukprot:c17458_g1_i1 orf=378-1562(-)